MDSLVNVRYCLVGQGAKMNNVRLLSIVVKIYKGKYCLFIAWRVFYIYKTFKLLLCNWMIMMVLKLFAGLCFLFFYL